MKEEMKLRDKFLLLLFSSVIFMISIYLIYVSRLGPIGIYDSQKLLFMGLSTAILCWLILCLLCVEGWKT
ncbi:MAG: hypothetical protein NZ893_03425 [Candidatus Aenigmarchaeota archaeon]|nr:hypothetical protein [Candidatus Aenigmarchaeota archaeon]